MRMSTKAGIGIISLAQGYYIWISDNLGVAFWFLLAVLAVNVLASWYTRSNVRNIPQDVASYTISILALVYGQNHMQLNLEMVKLLIILLLIHELKVTLPVFLDAMKKLGISKQTSDQAAALAEQAILQATHITPEQQQMALDVLKNTGTGKQV